MMSIDDDDSPWNNKLFIEINQDNNKILERYLLSAAR